MKAVVAWWELLGDIEADSFDALWKEHGLGCTGPHGRAGKYAQADVGAWLSTDIMYALCGVPLRPRSGVYFLPAEYRPHWSRVARCMPQHQVYGVETTFDAVTVFALANAVEREIEPWLCEVEAEIDQAHGRRRETIAREALSFFEKLGRWPGLRLPKTEARLSAIGDKVLPRPGQ